MDSTSLFFLSLRHPLISFSRAIGIHYTLKSLIIDKAVALVLIGEALDEIILVLEYTLTKSCGDACIKRAAGTATHHVNISESSFHLETQGPSGLFAR
jgi:hypothetical protein